MSWLVVGAILVIGSYLLFGKSRGNDFVQSLKDLVAAELEKVGEAEYAINNYINSREFAAFAKSSAGQRSINDAATLALNEYEAQPAKWRARIASAKGAPPSPAMARMRR
jgi:hypothetical protein